MVCACALGLFMCDLLCSQMVTVSSALSSLHNLRGLNSGTQDFDKVHDFKAAIGKLNTNKMEPSDRWPSIRKQGSGICCVKLKV